MKLDRRIELLQNCLGVIDDGGNVLARAIMPVTSRV
jgi:hypothetical protein